MKIALCHFVQMDQYEIPDITAAKGHQAIEEYILEKELEPVSRDTRDWEIVQVD